MISLILQAGGQSTRMGRDKALVPFLGKPLIQRLIERLSPLADETLITTNRPDEYRFLDVPLHTDLKPGRGALGGLYTALASAKNPYVIVVACDMPFANKKLFKYQYDLLISENADVVIPKSNEGFEPLHAVYRKETCLPAIETSIANDQWKLIAWFPAVNVRALRVEEIETYDPSGLAFSNVNTPEELAQAEAQALLEDK